MLIEPGVTPTETRLMECLERGDVIHFPVCPFALPVDDDLAFLLDQRLGSRAHKNIGYDPNTDKPSGYAWGATDQAEGLRCVLSAFSGAVVTWLRTLLPRYARAWQLDRVSYRPEEEATRRLRLRARNDLLHVDAFPSRPTNGWRILRVFANINPGEPRIWCTGLPFARLLELYGREAGLPDGRGESLFQRVQEGVLRLVRPRRRRSAYDSFMLRFHNFLKANENFQKTSPRRRWEFQAGSAWMVITDTASHAVLSGRYALEHSFFVAPHTLALLAESPPALLRQACGLEVLLAAA